MTPQERTLALGIVAVILLAHVWVLCGWVATPPAAWLAGVGAYAWVITDKVRSIVPLLLILPLLQSLLPAVRRPAKFRTYDFWLDLAYNFQSAVMYLGVIGGVIVGASLFLTNLTPQWLPQLAALPGWLQILIAVWLFDFVVYWRHRLFHTVAWLWPVHAVHHTSTRVDMFTTYRLHFIELMIGGIINRWVGGIAGLDDTAIYQGFVIYLYYNYYVHSNIAIRYPGPFKYLLVSPFMHRWHHALTPLAVNRNYAVVFAWHDWLFGTALHPDHEPESYGFDQDPAQAMRESYWSQQIYPFRRLVGYVRTRVRGIA